MNDWQDPRPKYPPRADRIPVLNTPATPEEAAERQPPGEPASAPENARIADEPDPIGDDDITALADRILDRLAPVLHDALVETVAEYLAERDNRDD